MPALLLRHGRVMMPGDGGPEVARGADGRPIDPFDVVDRLIEQYPRLYLVDLDGIERNRPQLDYLQEIARDVELWVDAGVRTGDQAIDILVTGAQRAVLSSAFLLSSKSLRRAVRLSAEIAFEIETRNGVPSVAASDWGALSSEALAQEARGTGVAEVILSPRESPPDWTAVRAIAQNGSTWVNGTFTAAEEPRLRECGATGGIFHITELLAGWSSGPNRRSNPSTTEVAE
jgi:phosphoribosylformimino-5-aminoimidazole carboxamide ribonucleotide (ProFAR) isomerase